MKLYTQETGPGTPATEGEFVAEIDFGSEEINAVVSWEAWEGDPESVTMRVDICLVRTDDKGNSDPSGVSWVDVGDLLTKEKSDELWERCYLAAEAIS